MTRLMFRVVTLSVLPVILSARAAEIPFTIALVTGRASPQDVVAKEVAARIVKNTGGRIVAKVFESGQTDAVLRDA